MTTEDDDTWRPKEDPFKFEEWAGKTRSGHEIILRDFRFDVAEIAGLVLEETTDLPLSFGEDRARRYVFGGPEAPAEDRFVIKTYEFDSVLNAHRGLMQAMATYMAPWLPRCESKGLELGDICFCGHDEPPTSAIFSRNNVLAEVQSVGRHLLPVAEVAVELDRQMYAD